LFISIGFSLKRRGPGFIPKRIKIPKRTAVTISPGTPKVSRGIKAPPVVALFADSGTATPSRTPSPKYFPFLESLLYCP
jgi:hypothetical protein